MQLDMHYYGTYSLARLAGMSKEASLVIATSAQFVDDNVRNEDIALADGSCVHSIATAHHAYDPREGALSNINKKDQRKVWVPFHFLPSAMGEDFSSQLVCDHETDIVSDVLRYSLDHSTKDFFLQLAGIITHVVEDTYSHYGFSGISCDGNKVDQRSIEYLNLDESLIEYVTGKVERFKERFKAELAETFLPLGHGAVYTYPDRPYLKWSYKYEGSEKVYIHDNPATFLKASCKVFEYYREIVKVYPECSDGKGCEDFDQIRKPLSEIINFQGKKPERIAVWQKYMSEGLLLPELKEEIPEYHSWSPDLDQLSDMTKEEVARQPVYSFLRASSIYRTYILRDLLPSSELIVG